jgi:hypothetical protein
MEKNHTLVHVIEHEVDEPSAATATAQHEEIQRAVDSFESTLHYTQCHARHIVCTEAARVNKRCMQQLEKEQPRKKQRQALITEEEISSRKQEQLLNQVARSRKMMQLLQRLEQVQKQLLDEMNACADDADLRGD